MAADVLGQLSRLITDQFRDIAAAGPAMYASFLGADGSDAERRHAHGTVAALGKALHAQGIRQWREAAVSRGNEKVYLAACDLFSGMSCAAGAAACPEWIDLWRVIQSC